MMHGIPSEVLAPEPPMVRGGDASIEASSGRWWVLHTKARNEKALAGQLHDFGVAYFLPLIRVPRTYGRRRVEVLIPLFPGYVFAAYETEEDRYRVLDTHRVANAISVSDQERLKRELEQIRRALMAQTCVGLYPGIRVGRRCRVSSGPLRGIEGVVTRRGRTGRVHLDVGLLGQSAVLEVEMTLLEAID